MVVVRELLSLWLERLRGDEATVRHGRAVFYKYAPRCARPGLWSSKYEVVRAKRRPHNGSRAQHPVFFPFFLLQVR